MTLRNIALMLHAGLEREKRQWRHTATISAMANAVMNENPKTPAELFPWAFGIDPTERRKTPEEIIQML